MIRLIIAAAIAGAFGIGILVGAALYQPRTVTQMVPQYCHSHAEDSPPIDCDYLSGRWVPRTP